MHDGFNGEGLPQKGRPTTRVSDVLTPARRSNAMDFLSNPNIQGQVNLSTPSLAVPRPQSLIQESTGKETNLHASRARPNLELLQTSHSANPSPGGLSLSHEHSRKTPTTRFGGLEFQLPNPGTGLPNPLDATRLVLQPDHFSMMGLSFAYDRVPVNAEATTLGFQRDLQTSYRERGDLKKRVVEKEPKDSIPATIPIPHDSCPPPLTTPVQQVRFSMASPQVSLLPPSRNAACQAPPS
jgi:hypothetical protein